MNMPNGAGSIIAYLSLYDVDFSKKLGAAAGQSEATAQKIQKGLNVALLAGAAAFAVSVAAAAKFEKEMANVNTLLDTSDRNFGRLTDGVLALAKEVPASVTSLTAGLYDLISAGADTSTAIGSLSLAAQAATAGVTGVDVAVKAGMATLNAYGMEMGELQRVYDLQFSTVKKGVLTYEQMGNAIGNVLPAAAALGVSLEDVYGSLAHVTKSGIEAQSATTYLARAFDSMVENREKWEKLGVAVFDVEGNFRGLEPVIGDLAGKLDGLTVEQQAMTLGTLDMEKRAKKAILSMTNNYEGFVETMADVADSSGAMEDAFKKQMATFSAQGNIFKNVIQTSFIEMGQELLPVLTSTLAFLNEHDDALVVIIKTLGKTVMTIGALVAAYKIYTLAAKALKTMNGLMATSFGPIGLIMVALVATIAALNAASQEQHKEFLANTDAISDNLNELNKLKSQYDIQQGRIEKATKGSVQYKAAVESQAKIQAKFEKILALSGKKLDDYNGSLKDAADDILNIKTDELREKQEGLTAALSALNTLQELRNIGVNESAEDNDRLTSAVARATGALTPYTSGWQRLMVTLGLTKGVTEDLLEKQAAVNKEQKETIDIESQLIALGIQTTAQLEEQKDLWQGYKDSLVETKMTKEGLSKAQVKQLVEYKELDSRIKAINERLVAETDKTKKQTVAVRTLTTDTGALNSVRGKSVTQLEEELALLPVHSDAWYTVRERLEAAKEEYAQIVTEIDETADAIQGLDIKTQAQTETWDLLWASLKGSENSWGAFKATMADTPEMIQAGIAGFGDLTRQIFDLGEIGDGALTLVQNLMQGLLLGGLNPVALGFQAASLALTAFMGKSEEHRYTAEELIESWGVWGDEILATQEAIDSIDTTAPIRLLDAYDDLLQKAMESSAFYKTKGYMDAYNDSLENIADLQERINGFLAAFIFETNFDDVFNALDFLSQKAFDLADYYGAAFDSTGLQQLIADQIRLGEIALVALIPGTQAYRDLQDEIWEAAAAQAVLNGEVETADEYYTKYGITLNVNRKASKEFTGAMIDQTTATTDGAESMKLLDATMEPVPAGLGKITEAAGGTSKALERNAAGFGLLDASMQPLPASLQDTKLGIDGTNESLDYHNMALRVANTAWGGFDIDWGDNYSDMIGSFGGFNTDLESALGLLDDINYFKVDLDATSADEQLGQLIFKMRAYVGEMDPSSQAYMDAMSALLGLESQFTAIGGEIPTDQTGDFFETAENGPMNGWGIPTAMSTLLSGVERLTAAIANISPETYQAGKQLTRDTALPTTTGGNPNFIKAHNGMLAGNELLAVLRNDEAVIPPDVTRMYSKPAWERFIESGDVMALVAGLTGSLPRFHRGRDVAPTEAPMPTIFQPFSAASVEAVGDSSGAGAVQQERNVQVMVNNPGPETYLDVFYSTGEKWLADRERNSVTVNHFRD